MMQVQQSESTAAKRTILVVLVDETDCVTPETGVTSPTVYISKNGGTASVGAGSWSEIDSTNMPGHYTYELTQSEVNTLGFVSIYIIKSGVSKEFNSIVQVIEDISIINAIKAKTDNLPTDPADQSLVESAISTSETNIIAEIDANEAKLDVVDSNIDAIVISIQKAIGLLHENAVIENSFVSHLHTLSTIYIYNSKTNAQTHNKVTGLLYTYSVAVNYNIAGDPDKITTVLE